jgi:hypothetical protein
VLCSILFLYYSVVLRYSVAGLQRNGIRMIKLDVGLLKNVIDPSLILVFIYAIA